MKKIAVLLALALALSCCLLMLAACGEGEESSAASSAETSSKDTSSSTETSSAATSSDEGSSAASSDEESSAASSDESTGDPVEETSDETSETSSEANSGANSEESPAESKPENGGSTGTDNLALGKSYTKSKLFQQGESVDDAGNKTWGWSDSAPVSYPDTGDKELTDGKFAANDSTYAGEEWFGFHSGCPDYKENNYSYFTVDLGDSCDLSKLVVYVGTSKLGGGIGVPATIEFLVSEDGTNFTSVGSIVPTDDPNNSVLAVEQACSATARYVQVRMTAANWMFVCEFEAY